MMPAPPMPLRVSSAREPGASDIARVVAPAELAAAGGGSLDGSETGTP